MSFERNTNNGVTINDYQERISYDPNGNILRYIRHGDAARLSMDSLNYYYKTNAWGTNHLDKVVDSATDASQQNYPLYNDIKQGQANGNYKYDAIGNLISDDSDHVTNITWNVYGKIKSVSRTGLQPVAYIYDASGNRIMKQTQNDTTVYVRDASGNVLSEYYKPANNSSS